MRRRVGKCDPCAETTKHREPGRARFDRMTRTQSCEHRGQSEQNEIATIAESFEPQSGDERPAADEDVGRLLLVKFFAWGMGVSP